MGRKVSKKITNNLLKALKDASIAVAEAGGRHDEKGGVESPFHQAFRTALPKAKLDTLYNTDGILRDLEDTGITALLEFKFDLDLKDSFVRSGVIVQTIYYLKEMIDRGKLVKAVFIGDVNECFCIPAKDLEKYLHREDIDWSIPASSVAEKNPDLVIEISEDGDIQPYIHDVNEKFDFQIVIEELESISFDEPCIISITPKNMVGIYSRFEKDVIKGKKFGEGLVWTIDGGVGHIVDVFFTHFTAPNEISVDEKKNILVCRGKSVKINRRNYNMFIARHKQEYDLSELEEIVANKDRILEDIHRRRTGAFFTPQIWADEAHKMIAEQFGENWKDEYVVWDCTAGTANLTRGCKFKELYISTLDQGDIDTINDRGYNPEAAIFQYDFLSEIYRNDLLSGTGIDKALPELKRAFESGKKVLFFINPPFGGASGDFSGGCPRGAGKNIVNAAMLENKMGGCSSQLYTQFMYKILSLAKQYPNQVSIALFSQSNFMTAPSYRKFRNIWEKGFQFLCGMLFDAGDFSDVSSGWGISFTIWSTKKAWYSNNKKILLLKRMNDKYEIETYKPGTKEMYNADEKACNKWIREEIKGKKFPEVLGYFDSGCNNIQTSNRGTHLYSNTKSQISLYGEEKSTPISSSIPTISINFRKVVALFAARILVKATWSNSQDEYLIPNTLHPDYEQWNNDAIAYGLFNTASRQSSFRNICYKNEWYNIENEFFFMSNKEMRELSGNGIFDELHQDTISFPKDRYVHNLLQTTPLSDDVTQLLEMAKDLIRKSMKKREEYHYDNDGYHLNAWDAGWAQLKPMLKQHYKEDYDKFVIAYKKLEDRMREDVYKFGFLRR